VVRGKDGGRGTMVPASQHAPSDVAQVLVQLESGAQVLVPAGALIRQQDGSDYVPLNLAELVPTRIGHRSENDPVLRVPVIAEELEVQKRVVETGTVRITKVVHEHETVIDEPLVAAEVEMERVPIQRVVEGPIPVRYEGDTVVVSLLEEVLVVEKRLMRKEELHIRKRHVAVYQPQQVTLRREEARIERLSSTEKMEQIQKE
jgi:uncharacterized protein (TIGR02271 family)